VLMIMLVIMVMGVVAFFVSSLSSSALQVKRDEFTANSLVQAKEALIGAAAAESQVTLAGYLKLPDLGPNISIEGNAAGNFSGNSKDFSVIGKVPWKTLKISPLRDGQNECLWYVVSGRFKNVPPTDAALNWDTLGQIDVIDGNGNVIANNVVALLVAPGRPLDAQSRVLSDPAYIQCGGNYDAQNYLDSYNVSDAVIGEINYFAGSTNNRVALNANNKRFVMTNNNHYNDQFLLVTTDDIFRPIIRRNDFSAQITALLNDATFIAHLQSTSIVGGKGTNNVNCNNTSNADNKTFCDNWKEMLLLAQLPLLPPTNITITNNGVSTVTGPCNRVVIFGGQRTSFQIRLTAANKDDPANYLEGANLTAFTTSPPPASNFSGALTFQANSPSTDLLRCI
jgi:hypothetical protein